MYKCSPVQNKMQKRSHILTLIVGIAVALSHCACSTQAKKTDEAITSEQAPKGRSPHIPEISKAQAKILWIPDKIEPDRWEEGHYLFIIDKPATWSSQ